MLCVGRISGPQGSARQVLGVCLRNAQGGLMYFLMPKRRALQGLSLPERARRGGGGGEGDDLGCACLGPPLGVAGLKVVNRWRDVSWPCFVGESPCPGQGFIFTDSSKVEDVFRPEREEECSHVVV